MKKKILLLSLIFLMPILFNSTYAIHEILEIKNYTEGEYVGDAWANHTVFDFNLTENGEHFIILTSEFTSGATNTYSKVRYVLINETMNETLGELVQQPKDLAHYYSATTTKLINVTNSSYTILVQYAGESAGTTSKVRNVKIQVIAPTYIRHANTTLSSVLTTNWTDITNLDFVAVQTGNYSFVTTAEINATTADISRIRALVNGTERLIMNYTSNDNMDFKGLIFHELMPLNVGDNINLTIQAQSETANSQVRNARVSIIAHLNGIILNQSETTHIIDSSSYVEIASIDLIPRITGINSIVVTAELNSTTPTDFDIITTINGTTVCNFIGSPKTTDDVYNYGCLDSINITSLSNTYDISTQLRRLGGGTSYAKNVRMLVSQFYIALIDTQLNLTFDDYFAIGENNLVQANYTYTLTDLPVENATCFLNSTTGSGNMTYNVSSLQYEIFVIPDVIDVGIIEFSVNCSKLDTQTQIQDQQYFSGIFAGTPYNITIGLFENLNATTPYIDEFAYIMIHGTDYNCTPVTSYEECWRVGEYTDGIATFNDTIGIGNFSIYFYSGSVTQSCELCPPYYETFTNLKHLGIFIFDSSRTDLYLYVSAAELNWERELLDWVMTRGIAIVGLALALLIGGTLAIIMFAKGGQNIAISVATFLLTVWIIIVFIEITFGVDLGLSSIMNLILP